MKTRFPNDQQRGADAFSMDYDGIGFKDNDPKNGSSESEFEQSSFWTVCPYCYYMFEYEKKYEDYCMRCQHCKRGFHGLAVAAPPESMFMKGKETEQHYSGYGFSPLGHSGGSFLSAKKKAVGGGTAKYSDVVEISDDSDDEKEKRDLKKEGIKGKRGMERAKSVSTDAKKMMGRGIKGKTFEKFGNGVGEAASGSGCQDGLNNGEFEFFEGDDDIFVSLKDC